MTIKTLLLGSAAAFAVIGGAQAADLSVAEPVEYVKVCDYFGTGYFYIPGSDSCLKISGYVRMYANFYSTTANITTDPSFTHSGTWDFQTQGELQFDVKSQTEYGALEGYGAFQGTYSGQPGAGHTTDEAPGGNGANSVTADSFYLSLGGFKAGHFQSIANPGGSYVDDFGLATEIKSGLADANKVQMSWAAAGFGIALAVEDPRETWGSALPDTWSMPLITGRISTSQTNWSGELHGGFTSLYSGTSWGVGGQAVLNLSKNDHLILNGQYGDDAFIGGGFNGYSLNFNPATNSGWSAFASFQHMFSPTFLASVEGSYLQRSGGGPTAWTAAADLVWMPVTNFKAKATIGYGQDNFPGGTTYSTGGSWLAQIAFQRSW